MNSSPSPVFCISAFAMQLDRRTTQGHSGPATRSRVYSPPYTATSNPHTPWNAIPSSSSPLLAGGPLVPRVLPLHLAILVGIMPTPGHGQNGRCSLLAVANYQLALLVAISLSLYVCLSQCPSPIPETALWG